MEITGNYSNYTTPYSDSVRKASTDNEDEKTKEKNEQLMDYIKPLEKLAPSVKFGLGYGLSSAKYGRTLQINPKILEKMQNDPEQEKETRELIAGIEKAMKISETLNKAGGWETRFSHWYIDENGKCWHTACTVKNDKMNKKLREESSKNSEKLIEKTKENSKRKKKELKELLKKNKSEKSEKKKLEKAEQLINEKISAAKDGIINMNDADIRKLMEALNEADNDIGSNDKTSDEGNAIDVYL